MAVFASEGETSGIWPPDRDVLDGLLPRIDDLRLDPCVSRTQLYLKILVALDRSKSLDLVARCTCQQIHFTD